MSSPQLTACDGKPSLGYGRTEDKVVSIYDSYKPLRNMMRQCNLEASLIDVWQLSQHITNNGKAPVQAGMPPYSLKHYLYPWDLPTVAREVLLNANRNGTKRLNSLKAMRTVVNTIRQTEDAGSKERLELEDVMKELHRISHRQFPWQQQNALLGLLRYMKIFGSPEVGPILERETGFTIREYFLLGLYLIAHLQQRVRINAQEDLTVIGVSREQSLKFFMKLSSTVEVLRELMACQQKYDETWEHTWNPLEATPLISLDPKNRHHLYCPVPDFLLRRFSHGMYFDLVKASGFDTAFGTSFENYIGEVLRAVFAPPNFTVYKEEKYYVGKDLHHGADWILTGADANLFIECKTKRMIRTAKFSVGGPDLVGEIGIIADAVVQLYKNVKEAEEGKSKWVPNGLQSFPLVITLEDWFMFGPLPQGLLRTGVTDRMTAAGLDLALLKSMPYAVASAREFERFTGVVQEVSIQSFFNGKNDDNSKQWMWEEYARDRFPDAKRTNLQDLFRQEWRDIFPTEVIFDEPLLST
jgi:hypothetical protein